MRSISSKGTSKYIVGPIERFDQKNEMFKRARWDPRCLKMGEKFYLGTYSLNNKKGYRQENLAFSESAWYIEAAFAHGNRVHDSGMYSWQTELRHTHIPQGFKLEVNDSIKMSQYVKKVAIFLGASKVGICDLDRRWIYSHSYNASTGEHKQLEVPEEYKYAIMLLFEMDYELVKASPTWIAEGATGKAYSTMPFTASMLAQFIRGLGYKAIPSGNDTCLSIPMAIDAGLGELGRNGLIITREFGPRVRIAKVLTDLPLFADEPIEFGVTEFCSNCEKCAEFCPSQAIMYGDRTAERQNMSNAGGVLKWPINAEKCFSFWVRNQGSCCNCIRVCPLNKPQGWLHESLNRLVGNTPWLDRFIVMMDDLLGYGKQVIINMYSLNEHE